MSLNQWFEKGLTPEQYMAHLDNHKEGFHHVYENFQVPEDEDFLQLVKSKRLRVIVLAEVWCGHCMFNIPVLLRLAEKTEMPVKLLPRDENLELMDQYLTNGKSRTIPIFIFIDENGQEVAKWGPKSAFMNEFLPQHMNTLPPKDSEDYEGKFKELITFLTTQFKENSDFWNATYESMKEVLTEKLGIVIF